jgi:pimeloyl-ACP methyl ester carboxylesterase
LPDYAAFMHRLGRLARVTVFDKRGTGMSDRINSSIPIEERMLDIGAILDALDIESAVLLGIQDGGAIASMFAACRPERVRGLIWYAAARRLLQADDYPFGMPAAMFEQVCAAVEPNWGAPLFAEFVAPSRAEEPEYLAWWADYIRNGASPSTAKWMLELNATIDIAPLLPTIGVPTLVMHRRGDRMMPLPGGKLVADGILDARWVELDGHDHQPPRRGWGRVLVCPHPAPGHAPRGTDPRRARGPHGLQLARTADQPGARPSTAARGVRSSPLPRSRAGARFARQRAGVRGPWIRGRDPGRSGLTGGDR